MGTQETAISNLALTPQESENNGAANAAQTGDSPAIVTEKSTVRAYWKFVTKKVKAKDGTVSEKTALQIQAKAESAKKDNWKKLEEQGFTLLSENDFVRYTVKAIEAAPTLVEDAAQQAYVFQSGVNYIQNSKMNAFSIEIKEGTGTGPDNPPIPLHNGEEIDLKASINEKPGRRSLTQLEKLDKMLEAMGLSPAARAEFLRNAAQSYEAAKAAGAVPAESDEEEEEGGEEEGEEVPAVQA